MWQCQLANATATQALGRQLAEELLAAMDQGLQHAPVLLLVGELGAGKTCLVQGLAAGLGIDEPITSPSFALAQHYQGEIKGAAGPRPTALVHVDLYRLEQPASADELFAQEEEEALGLGAVLAVEWPQRLSFKLEDAWRLELEIAGDARLARLERLNRY